MHQSHRSGGAVIVASAILLLTACSAAHPPPEGGQDGPSGRARKVGGQVAVADPAAVQANELGAVPVLMYHQLVAEPRSVYDRTPQDFRAELERLARERYVPITARDFSSGNIDIPAGTHPVVLTFDDSTVTQFRLGTDGRPASDTAVGILLDTAQKHPGFRPVATFFVNADPFGEPGGRKSLDWLVKHEFEVGNHTLRHTALGTVDDDTAQKAIADNQKAITQAVPGLSVVSMALPYGSMSHSRQLVLKGAADGVSYQHQGVYLVGANPAPSPFSADFDPGAIPRIRSQAATGPDAQFTSTAWLDKLRDGTVKRYTSGGDPKTISFPKSEAARLAPAHRRVARPY
ncbi:polysaccharide deacetylase family protein [Streptomyces sp. NPDC094438]|uniref:polysaccharide deacetylase family protein n=1 Tax=Streptomyces sp. NPDC094438 TaxID=3366061 RepID=UPI00381C0C5C